MRYQDLHLASPGDLYQEGSGLQESTIGSFVHRLWYRDCLQGCLAAVTLPSKPVSRVHYFRGTSSSETVSAVSNFTFVKPLYLTDLLVVVQARKTHVCRFEVRHLTDSSL